MSRPSRREFLRTVSAVGVGAPRALQQADPRAAYERAVLAEPSLLAFWPFNGGLSPGRGGPPGEAHGGSATYAVGPLGAQALRLDAGRFVEMPDARAFDTDASTVEMFFQVAGSAAPGYNPCLIAKRASSQETRFSVHYAADRTTLMVWNGDALGVGPVPNGPLGAGEWHHLAVANDAQGVRMYLDGVRVNLSPVAFAAGRRGLPLVIGASSPAGEEPVSGAIAEVAIYGAALTAEQIARHVDAAGWTERRRKLEADRRRIAAEQERVRREKLARRRADPRLTAIGAPAVYEGERLTAIGFPLGGIGAGTIQMNGKAERFDWQIFNAFSGAPVPDSFFAIRVHTAGGKTVVRALQTSRVGPFPAMARLQFRGEYPFATYRFADEALPVQVSLEAFSPLIPLLAKESAIPCAIFTVRITNPTPLEVDVSVLASQQNAVCYDGKGPVLERRFRGYGGNVNHIQSDHGVTTLQMTTQRDKTVPSYGSMALIAFDPEATGNPSYPGLSELHRVFRDTGELAGPQDARASAPGETHSGALASRLRIAAGKTAEVRFALTWHFPNAQHGGEIKGWEHAGNQYATCWEDAAAVARYLAAEIEPLTAQTRLYHKTFYESNLPYWLRDRISSQVAILRSKTCYWAADGYFGAWEGCAPEAGCCAGNCTHVWHYAQAHARLFPQIARKMREETYSYQRADGGLPHRHPSFEPAADGLLGDVLGVYREHLTGTDTAWLTAMWPKAQKAMEYAVRTWDPDEDGQLSGAQWNTLDGALGGSTTWIGSLYLAALSACERMAALQGDTATAQRYRRIRTAGATNQNAALWNGEYYIQRRDPQPHADYGDGCEIDQLLGEWWARQVGLPAHYPADRIQSALASIVKYNFRPDFHGLVQVPRKFVDDSDAGTQMIQWPKGDRPSPTILYGDEVMTGFEYAAAATMVQNGMLRDGLMLALAVSDRYDGRLRTGLTAANYASWGYSGNPFGDDECGKFYARAMSVWSLLLAGQGFEYDGPAGVIAFRPVWRPNDHRSFFTAAEGWGLFTQRRTAGRQECRIDVRWGRLRLREVRLAAAPSGHRPISVTVGGKPITSRSEQKGDALTVTFANETVVAPSLPLEIRG